MQLDFKSRDKTSQYLAA